MCVGCVSCRDLVGRSCYLNPAIINQPKPHRLFVYSLSLGMGCRVRHGGCSAVVWFIHEPKQARCVCLVPVTFAEPKFDPKFEPKIDPKFEPKFELTFGLHGWWTRFARQEEGGVRKAHAIHCVCDAAPSQFMVWYYAFAREMYCSFGTFNLLGSEKTRETESHRGKITTMMIVILNDETCNNHRLTQFASLYK